LINPKVEAWVRKPEALSISTQLQCEEVEFEYNIPCARAL
jgi:hypothetical protein